MLSLVLHGVLLLVIGYCMRFVPQGAGPGEPENRTVGVALVKRSDGERQILTSEQAQQQAAEAAQPSNEQMSEVLPEASELSADLSDVLPTADQGFGSAESLSVPEVGATGRVMAGQLGEGDQVRTSVFGAAGNGSRFVYVFDRSGSMGGLGGRPLAAAKRELRNSLADLVETSQFQIIFYNQKSEVFTFGGRQRMVFANEDAIHAATRFVSGVKAFGSTRHLQAIQTALRLRPDVMFFLTDGNEGEEAGQIALEKVRNWNRSTMINTIEFGSGPVLRDRQSFLVRLARENGGQYVYVDISELPPP